MSLLYHSVKPIVGVALQWYYRSLVTANLDRIPLDGPIFLAANHPNALTDAMVLGWASPRRVRYTAKATLFAHPIGAPLLRAVGVIPLRRVADEQAAHAAPVAVDASRNAISFSAVADALVEHACVAIFPEGKTSDDPYMAPVRTGLARMALMARDERGVRGIRIVPIGLLFESKAEPRTRVLLQVGEPIDVDAMGTGDHVVAALTDVISQRLRAITLNFESHEDAERIQLLGETLLAIVEPTVSFSEGAPSLSRSLGVVRRIARAQQILRQRGDPVVAQRIDAFEQQLRAFRRRLTNDKLNVHDLGVDFANGIHGGAVLREIAIACVMLPISLWGRITHYVPIRLTRYVALRNVRALDQPPTRSFVLGVILVVLTYAVLTTLVAITFGGWWALGFFLTLVPSASRGLRYTDRLQRMRQRVHAFRLFRRSPSLQQSLQHDADALQREAGALEQLATGS